MSEGRAFRRLLAASFLFGAVGTRGELILLEHMEDAWQKAPLVLIGIGCAGLAVVAIRGSRVAIRIFQLIMLAFIASGVAGIALHYQGNVGFELELQPDAASLGLFGRR
jgi:hypothetical protein